MKKSRLKEAARKSDGRLEPKPQNLGSLFEGFEHIPGGAPFLNHQM